MKEILLIQQPGDRNCCRVSAGGHADMGYYCVFQGDRKEVTECLRQVLKALEDPAHTVKVDNKDDLLGRATGGAGEKASQR